MSISGRVFARTIAATFMFAVHANGAGAEEKLPPPTDDILVTGGFTSQPIGHYEFCKAHRDECAIRARDTGPLKITDKIWDKVVAINIAVNASIHPENDIVIYGRDEVWDYPNSRGDCEDYVLEKRRELNLAGIPLSNLLITVVKKPDGEGHAVLTLRTDEGDFILDNLNDSVRRWSETGYKFIKRQSSENTGRWVSLQQKPRPMHNAPAVASVQ